MRRRRLDERASLAQQLGAEFLGTAFLLATVIGSGIMGERLAGRQRGAGAARQHAADRRHSGRADHHAGADLRARISIRRSRGVFWLRGEIGGREAGAYIARADRRRRIIGVLAAHAMFELPLLQLSARRSAAAWRRVSRNGSRPSVSC